MEGQPRVVDLTSLHRDTAPLDSHLALTSCGNREPFIGGCVDIQRHGAKNVATRAIVYVESLRIENFRTFRTAEIELLHPGLTRKELRTKYPIDKLLFPNVNLILGNNGSGKTTFLKALALACLGPVVSEVRSDRLVRREPGAPATLKRRLKRVKGTLEMPNTRAIIKAGFLLNPQDHAPRGVKRIDSRIRIDRKGSFEKIIHLEKSDAPEWDPIFSEESDAMFFVGYGANRRSEDKERFDASTRKSAAHGRARRVMSLFEETYSLVPLANWLPGWGLKNKKRYPQVVKLLQRIVGDAHWTFTGKLEAGEYLFKRGDQLVPFPALSDGYRAFYGWLGDLLYHVCSTLRGTRKLADTAGIVMIDEIDLHLHPSWQMEVLPRLSKEFPKLQFVVTSHSPLVVGSLQWANLIVLESGDAQTSTLVRKEIPVHGLDADQILITPFFGLDSTRASASAIHLQELSTRASAGDSSAASQLLREMSQGSETSALPPAP